MRIMPDVARLSTAEKIGQMLMVRYPDRGILEAMLRDGTAGSFYFGMKGLSAPAVAETLNRLQAMAKFPALIAFGSATTSCGAGLLRGSQMRLGATRSAELAYQVAYREAREQRAYGCHLIDSPCLDVNTNPANPIINTRAFGDQPELVTELGLAMLQGIVDARAVTCGMHFPGHGATADDSHIRVPVDRRDAETLWRVDLLPWRRAIAANLLNAICTNHVHYPALAPGRVEPSTVSRAVITGLLRERLGYQGLILSDSLTMKPMKDEFGIEEAAIRTVLAGHDIILQDYQSDPAITLRALVGAVDSGRIPVAQIDAAVARILALKGWLGLFEQPLVDVSRLAERVATPDDRAVAVQVARLAVTALETAGLPLRLPAGAESVVITHGGSAGSGNDAQSVSAAGAPGVPGFLHAMRQRLPGVRHLAVRAEHAGPDAEAAWAAARAAHTVIFALFPRVVCYHEDSVRLAPPVVELIRRTAGAGPQVVLLVFGNPYVLQDLPRAHTTLCAYDHDCPESIEATVAALFGEIPAPGRLPVTLPGAYAFGAGA
jgi:beta-N-acetylhexosaminidase